METDDLVALTATEYSSGPSVSTWFTTCHIRRFPTRFPRRNGFEGSAGPKQSLEVQKLTSNPSDSPSVRCPLPTEPRKGATKLPRCGASIVGIEATAFMELCYARFQSMCIRNSRKTQHKTFYGLKLKPLTYLLGSVNIILHGIEGPAL